MIVTRQILLENLRIDPYAKRLLEFVFVNSKGGFNRTRMILILKKEPLNANQLAKKIGLDYKAIQHHVGVLEKNNLISHMGEKYGIIFFPSVFLEHNMMIFDALVAKRNEKPRSNYKQILLEKTTKDILSELMIKYDASKEG